jgi:hypothetical protein
MISVYGVVKKILGGCPGGEFYTAEGKCRCKIILEEDQSYEKKDGTHVEKLVLIPIAFFGDNAEKANDEKYLEQAVKVDLTLGGWNPEGEKWYPNLNGVFIHRQESGEKKKTEADIPF